MKKLVTYLLGAVLLLALSFSSCSKDEETFRTRITVVTADGVPLQNVMVNVYAPERDGRTIPKEGLEIYTGFTNLSGEVTLEYQAEAVLQIRATKGERGSSFFWLGCGFVKLEADEVVSQTVILRPYDPITADC